MHRREFTALLPALFAATAHMLETASAQQPSSATAPPAKTKGPLPEITSGVYPPCPATGSGGRTGHRYLAGMLKAGNIQIEMHETRQEPGTPHEAIGHHLHNEIWLVREGICELTTNGITRPPLRGQRRRHPLQLLRSHRRPARAVNFSAKTEKPTASTVGFFRFPKL